MEMSCPSCGPTEVVPFQHFPNPKSWVLSAYNEQVYLDLAFCLGAGAGVAARAGLGAGSGAGAGLTD